MKNTCENIELVKMLQEKKTILTLKEILPRATFLQARKGNHLN